SSRLEDSDSHGFVYLASSSLERCDQLCSGVGIVDYSDFAESRPAKVGGAVLLRSDGCVLGEQGVDLKAAFAATHQNSFDGAVEFFADAVDLAAGNVGEEGQHDGALGDVLSDGEVAAAGAETLHDMGGE